MTDQFDARISALEDAYEIEKLMNLHVRHFDSLVNGRADGLDPSLYLREFRWDCKPFGSCDGFDAYARFVEAYSQRVSFSLQLLAPLGTDIDVARAGATGRWGVWQPFTLEGKPWVLAGQFENSFVREDSWRLASIDLRVDILTPWSAGWGDERIYREWNW
jgi:hypothetical protein